MAQLHLDGGREKKLSRRVEGRKKTKRKDAKAQRRNEDGARPQSLRAEALSLQRVTLFKKEPAEALSLRLRDFAPLR